MEPTPTADDAHETLPIDHLPPNETLYVNNLNDKINPSELKKHLGSIFKQFGEIRQIIALKSFWRRGQAWIVFRDTSTATNAMNGLQGFPFFERPLRITYAMTKSDIIAKEQGTYVPRPKSDEPRKPRAIRAREKSQKVLFDQMQNEFITHLKYQMSPNPPPPPSSSKETLLAAVQAKAVEAVREATKRKTAPPPLPPMLPKLPPSSDNTPNKTLFVENLPPNTAEADLIKAFENFAGFVEVRLIASRSIAFVDFTAEMEATHALHEMSERIFNDVRLRVTYAK